MTDPKLPASQDETPEDVATLYSWANLHGSKYRDFSAARAEAREEARLRFEEAQAIERRRQEKEEERRLQEEAQEALRLAAEAAEVARQVEAERLAEVVRQTEAERQAVLAAQEAQRLAAQQRAWEAPPAEIYTGGNYAASPLVIPSTPVSYANHSYADHPDVAAIPGAPPAAQPVPSQPQRVTPAPPLDEFATPDFFSTPAWSAAEPTRPAWLAPDHYSAPMIQQPAAGPSRPVVQQYAAPEYPAAHPSTPYAPQAYRPPVPSTPNPSQPPGSGFGEDARGGSRDRIAHRWFALKSVFDTNPASAEPQPSQTPARVPAIAVFSLAGGVGKTSLVAALGRALSSRGEHVLLVDTAVYGLLPFFFGARDQRPGVLRTFNPPGPSVDASVQLITLDPESQPSPDSNYAHGQSPSDPNHDWLLQEIVRLSRGSGRVIFDLPTASGSTTRRILRMNPIILVPVVPDMNSVVSVSAIESFFRNNSASAHTGGKPVMPYYLLNHFDYSVPLHLDVREILREQIGDRLLPFALRRSSAVSEALAEGMTVMDYAPNAPVAEDYGNLAGWVRSLSAPASAAPRGVRWSER